MSPLLPDALKTIWTTGPGQVLTTEELMAEQDRLIGEYARIWTDAMILPGRGALLDSLASEIAQHTRFTDPDEVHRRWKSAVTDVRDEWCTRVTIGRDRDEVTAFYDRSEAYIFDLMAWHSLADDNGPLAYVVALRFAEQHGCRACLDFGSGVGSGAILFGRHGFAITLADISSNLLSFARARCEARGLTAAYIDLKLSGLPDASFDIVTAMDVWEHLTDPVQTASQIAKAVRPGGFLFGRFAAEPDENHPQHIVFDFEPTFRKLAEEGLVEVWRDEWLWGHQAFQKKAESQAATPA